MSSPLNILVVHSSSRRADSVTRRLAEEVAAGLAARHPASVVVSRDVADGVPFVDDAWITAAFTPPEQRKAEQSAHLSYSDALVAEVAAADILVIGAPIYNFGMPAALKAWFDQIARARLTFAYTDKGPVGLLKGKKAILVEASGGVPLGAPVDFLTGHLKQLLAFIGIKDVFVVAAEGLSANAAQGLAKAASDAQAAIEWASPVARAA